MSIGVCRVKPCSVLFVSVLCLSGCGVQGVQTHGVFISVETECESIIESVEVVFGDHSEYCGSIGRKGGYTIVGIDYPVLLDMVKVRFLLEGEQKAVEVPLKRLAPRNLPGSYEVVFNIVCGTNVVVQTSFWRFVEVEGKRTKGLIGKNG